MKIKCLSNFQHLSVTIHFSETHCTNSFILNITLGHDNPRAYIIHILLKTFHFIQIKTSLMNQTPSVQYYLIFQVRIAYSHLRYKAVIFIGLGCNILYCITPCGVCTRQTLLAVRL
jgi:hypothetical protein